MRMRAGGGIVRMSSDEDPFQLIPVKRRDECVICGASLGQDGIVRLSVVCEDGLRVRLGVFPLDGRFPEELPLCANCHSTAARVSA